LCQGTSYESNIEERDKVEDSMVSLLFKTSYEERKRKELLEDNRRYTVAKALTNSPVILAAWATSVVVPAV
jgi:hypothetical protein